jgi:hypothetical protein
LTDSKRKPNESSLLSNKYVLREISELKREIEYQKKLVVEFEKDKQSKLDDPFFQKLTKLRTDNREKESQLKLRTKNYRQLESSLKKVCLINVKLEAKLKTEEELAEFRKSRFYCLKKKKLTEKKKDLRKLKN